MSIIFQSVFAHNTQAPPQASWCGGPSVTICNHTWCFCRVNSGHYIAQVVNPVLLPFLQQEGHVLYHQDNAHPHMAAVMQVLSVVYNNCLGQKDPQISCQLNMFRTWWSGNLFFLQSLPQPLTNCDNRCKMLGTLLSQDDIRHFYNRLHARIHTCIAVRWKYTVYWFDCLGTPYCDVCVSFGLNLLSYTPTMINYLWHQFSKQWTCPWRCCIFFPR